MLRQLRAKGKPIFRNARATSPRPYRCQGPGSSWPLKARPLAVRPKFWMLTLPSGNLATISSLPFSALLGARRLPHLEDAIRAHRRKGLIALSNVKMSIRYEF